MADVPRVDPRLEEAMRLQEEDERQREEAAREKQVRRCYVNVFSSQDGRVVLNDLRKQYYDVDGYVPGFPNDSHALACVRNVVLRILTILAQEADAPKVPQTEAET